MHIELTSPACLLLGLIQLDGQICQLGVALRYPPIQLLARPSSALTITGGRADLAYRQAEQYYANQRTAIGPHPPTPSPIKGEGETGGSLSLARDATRPRSPAWETSEAQRAGWPGGEGPHAEIEIELAIPAYMGLGSSAMLGLSVTRALALLHGQPSDDARALARSVGLAPDEALEAHAFAQGGLLLVDGAGALRRRQPIADHDEDDDWVFVLALPRVPPGTPETLEAERRQTLRDTAAHLDPQTGRICISQLWPAVERDDIVEFAGALMAIQAANYAALAEAGQALVLSADEQAILEVMRGGGALAWGRCISGMGLYGLIKGGGPSRVLRRRLTEQQGYFGAAVMATLCDSHGARQRVMGS